MNNSVNVNLPVGPNDEKVIFPSGRIAGLPDIYICENHPLHKGPGKAYYYIQDGSPEGMARVVRMEHNDLSVPSGGEQEAKDLGFLKLVPGDIMFVRLSTSSSTGDDDVPVCWLNGPNLFSDDLVKRVKEVRARVLGDREDRSRYMPEGRGRDRTGGTRFERDFPPGENVRDGRCYPYGASFEGFTKYYAPCAQSKVESTDPNVISYRSDLLKITIEMATLSLRAGPECVSNGLSLNHHLMNFPSVGTDDNYYFGSNQLNLAPAEVPNSSSNLESSLGNAGAAHIDANDSPAHFTNMTSISDLPEDFDPGRFFVLYPGVFYELGEFTSFCFSGLRRHGGTSPVAPSTASEEEKDWAVRATLVSYPLTGSVSYMQRRVMCGDGMGSSFVIPPEMIVPRPIAPFDTNVTHSTFAREGPFVMSRVSLMDFICRSFLQLVVFVLHQVSPSLNARVNSDAFLASFSYDDESGSRRCVGPWVDGPGWRRHVGSSVSTSESSTSFRSVPEMYGPADDNGDQYRRIEELSTMWQTFYKKYAGHIPYAVAVKKDVDPLEGWVGDAPPKKITSLKYPKSKGKRVSESVDDDDCLRSSSTRRRRSRTKASSVRENGVDLSDIESDTLSSVNDSPRSGSERDNMLSDVESMTLDDWFDEQASSDVRGYAKNVSIFSDQRSQLISPAVLPHSACIDEDVHRYPSSEYDHSPAQATIAIDNADLSARVENMSTGCPSGEGGEVDCDTVRPEQATSPFILNNTVENSHRCHSPSPAVDMSSVQATSLSVAVSGISCDVNGSITVDPFAGQPSVAECIKACEVDWDAVQRLSETDRALLSTNPALVDLPNDVDMEEVDLPEDQPSDPGTPALADLPSDDDMEEVIIPDDHPSESDLPGFFRIINSDVVYGELMSVQNNAIAIKKRPTTNDGGDPSLLASALEHAVRGGPLDKSTLSIVSQARGRLFDMSADERVNTLNLKQLRCSIMFINYMLWYWLQHSVRLTAAEILTGFSIPCLWLRSLLNDIALSMRQRRRTVRFTPSAYGIDIKALAPVVIDFEDYGYKPGDKVMFDHDVLSVLNDIVAHWFGYDRQSTSLWQAAYVGRLLDYIGIEVLYLDCVWKTYQRVTEGMMEGKLSYHIPLKHGAMAYPLFNPRSRLRMDMCDLAGMVRDFVAGKMDMVEDLGVDRAANRLEQVLDNRVASFKKFVHDSFVVHFLGGSTLNAVLDNLLRKEGDRYLMFREHAPSRMHVMKADGPFSPSNVRTLEAVFSGVAYRATTFDTPFSRKGRTMFKSPEDFFAATKEAQCTKESDYCNISAYGQPDPGRKAKLVYEYWDRVHQYPWPGLSSPTPIGFMECYHYFYPTSGPARFSHLGRLGAYLLTADYVYAGMVEPPTADEMAVVIKQLNKGAMSAFETLGFSSTRDIGYRGKKNKLNEESVDVADMIERATELVKSSIPIEWHQCIGLDYIVTEHALCKFSRVTSGSKPKVRM